MLSSHPRSIPPKRRCGLGAVEGLSLSEIASLIEIKFGRQTLISSLRRKIYPLTPSGGIVDLPLYRWKDIYTTNYDNIIEKTYSKRGAEYTVISTNYDFEKIDDIKQNIFKIHGTIDKDVVDGSISRIIITESDYAHTDNYREDIYSRLLAAGSTANLLVVGHSLSDPDLNAVLHEAVRRRQRSGSIGRVYALVYTRDENRALLVEQRGVKVAFGGLDDLLAAFADKGNFSNNVESAADPVEAVAGLSSTVLSVRHAIEHQVRDTARMFFGAPANYGDIKSGSTFQRDLALVLESKILQDSIPILMLIGVAGVGKSTLVRQVLSRLSSLAFHCWEHIDGSSLNADRWMRVETKMREEGHRGVLFVDDSHRYISEIGKIADHIRAQEQSALHIIMCSSKAHWNHRTKSDGLLIYDGYHELRQLSISEVDNLLDLLERNPDVAALAEREFSGFSRQEKRRRLVSRCSADFFVCLRNIFSTDILDDIILREYAELQPDQQKVYRYLSALEASGILPHRQTILRSLVIHPDNVSTIRESMDGMVEETTFDATQGIYVWRGRHPVISEIIRKAKFSDPAQFFSLLEKFIDDVNPTYEIERHNLIEVCDKQGIGRISSKESQNILFRKIISKAPSLRVPRHRLISNLINGGEYEQASNEIRIFESDLNGDGPLCRLKALIPLRRAQHAKGLMEEDRAALISEGVAILSAGVSKYRNDRRLFETYCEAGIQSVKFGSGWSVLDEALKVFEERASVIGDPEFTRSMNRYKVRARQIQVGEGSMVS